MIYSLSVCLGFTSFIGMSLNIADSTVSLFEHVVTFWCLSLC